MNFAIATLLLAFLTALLVAGAADHHPTPMQVF
jgi:hypothetical protein